MPLYDYQCAKCGKVFEVRQKFSDEPLTTHEGCGGEVTKLLSAPAFQFKGSGWYITDYARSGGASKSESAGSEASGSTETKTESKPAETKSSESTSATTTTKSE